MSETADALCPYCGEAVELIVDEGGGPRQRYVEDCPVCCRPWEVALLRTHEEDGVWIADLRRLDD